MPTTTATGTTPSAVLQNLQTNYGPQAQAVGQVATNAYFAHLGTLEVISAILSTCFFAATIYFLVQTGWLANRIDRVRDVVLRKDSFKARVKSSWDDIERHFFAGDDNDLKIAIIEADTLLDEALVGVGVSGSQLGDRLKKVRPDQIGDIDAVWQAHKLRNQIAHEANFVLKRDLAERALTVYEKALENLGALDPEVEKTEETKATPPTPPAPPTAKHH
jgi:hypothetical protein